MKSNFNVSQRCKFLGFIHDTTSMSIKLPDEKEQKVNRIVSKRKRA